MMSRQYLVGAAGLLGACGVGLLAQWGGLIVPDAAREALTGRRAAAHAELERQESLVPANWVRDDGRWMAHLQVVEAELAAGHLDAAVRAWHDAYGAALGSRSWESMIAVGDAFVRIGRTAGTPAGARMNAREAYMTALIRARRNGSLDGALRSAEAFAGLGDRAIVEQSLYIAERLAAGDEQAQERVREARLRWPDQPTLAGVEERR